VSEYEKREQAKFDEKDAMKLAAREDTLKARLKATGGGRF
jgi:hypothetical protein